MRSQLVQTMFNRVKALRVAKKHPLCSSYVVKLLNKMQFVANHQLSLPWVRSFRIISSHPEKRSTKWAQTTQKIGLGNPNQTGSNAVVNAAEKVSFFVCKEFLSAHKLLASFSFLTNFGLCPTCRIFEMSRRKWGERIANPQETPKSK